MPPIHRHVAALVVAMFVELSVSFTSGRAADWNQFRGPGGDGVDSTATCPTSWSEEVNLGWTVPVAGQGWASPIVAGDRVFLVTAVPQEPLKVVGFGGGVLAMRGLKDAKPPAKPLSFEVRCHQLSDGRSLWTRVIDRGRPEHAIHPSNTYATESPVTDGTHVYVSFAAVGVVACLDVDGNVIWKTDVGQYPTSSNFGTGSSLTMADGRVFLQCDSQGESFLAAFDAVRGEELWRVRREGGSCWSTPLVWRNSVRTELVVLGDGVAQAFDPASGEPLWSLAYPDGSFAASPAVDGDLVYFGNSGPGRRGPLVAVRAGASGKISMSDAANSDAAEGGVAEGEAATRGGTNSIGGVAWVRSASGPGLGSPVAYRGRVYVESRGVLTCHDGSTGRVIYKKRLPGAGSVAASMWVVEGRLHVLDESGQTFVIRTGDEFELLAKNKVPGLYWSTPSVAGGGLLLRSADALHFVRGNE